MAVRQFRIRFSVAKSSIVKQVPDAGFSFLSLTILPALNSFNEQISSTSGHEHRMQHYENLNGN